EQTQLAPSPKLRPPTNPGDIGTEETRVGSSPEETSTAIGLPSKMRAQSQPGAASPPPLPRAQTPLPVPGPPGTVDAACKEIERAISRATADRVLITFAASRFKTALLLMVQDGVCRGARGPGPRPRALRTIAVALDG